MVAKFLFIVIMINGTFCANSLLQLSSLSDWRELRSALIVKCVFNSCLSYTAIVLNVMTMYPVQKASPLPKNLTTLCQVLLLLKLEFGFICGCYFRRFLGIHLHLREQELVIGKRVVTVVISIYGCKEQHLLFAILRCYCSLKHQVFAEESKLLTFQCKIFRWKLLQWYKEMWKSGFCSIKRRGMPASFEL